jgi:putative salt-induced outer membrane protein YdiY
MPITIRPGLSRLAIAAFTCAMILRGMTEAAAQGPTLAPAFTGEGEIYRLPPVTDEPIVAPPPTPAVEVEIVPTPDPKSDVAIVVEETPPPPPKIWEASVELGLNGSTGNSEVFTARYGAHAKRCVPTDTLTLDLNYSRGSRAGVLAENRAVFDARNEWTFKDNPWSPFVKGSVEYDEFRAFNVRVVANAGLGYQFIKNDLTTLIGRLGSGFSQEIGGPDDDITPEGLAGLDFEHNLSEIQKISAGMEYFPDIGDVSDFRAVNKAAWEMLVDPRWNTSLKLAANHRYDSTPHGAKKNDLDYTLLVMWKY